MNNLPFDVLNHIQSFIPPNKEDIIAKTYEDANYPSLEKLFTLLKKKECRNYKKRSQSLFRATIRTTINKDTAY